MHQSKGKKILSQKDNSSDIAFVSFSLEWLSDDKDKLEKQVPPK